MFTREMEDERNPNLTPLIFYSSTPSPLISPMEQDKMILNMSNSPSKMIRVEYQAMLTAFVRMSRLAQDAKAVKTDLLLRREALEGEWVGGGAKKFFDEMDDDIFPALGRLEESLETAARFMADLSKEMGASEQGASDSLLALPLARDAQTSGDLSPSADPIEISKRVDLGQGHSLPMLETEVFADSDFVRLDLYYGEDGIQQVNPDGVDLIPTGAPSDETTIGWPVNAPYTGKLLYSADNPHALCLIPEDDPTLMLIFSNLEPLQPEDKPIDAGESIGHLIDISQIGEAIYPEGTPNHLHIDLVLMDQGDRGPQLLPLSKLFES